MSVELPGVLTYGRVTGRFILAVADSADAGSDPDGAPATGKVRFTPAPSHVVLTSPEPMVVSPRPIECSLDDQGYLVDPQKARGVTLLAGDNVASNPTNWTYRVSIDIQGLQIAPFNLMVQGGMTHDLALASPVPNAPGTVTVVTEASRVAAQAAAAQALDALATIQMYAPVVFVAQGAPLPADVPDPALIVRY